MHFIPVTWLCIIIFIFMLSYILPIAVKSFFEPIKHSQHGVAKVIFYESTELVGTGSSVLSLLHIKFCKLLCIFLIVFSMFLLR